MTFEHTVCPRGNFAMSYLVCGFRSTSIGSLSQVSKSKLEPWLPRVVVSTVAVSSASSMRCTYSYLVLSVAKNAKRRQLSPFDTIKSHLFVGVRKSRLILKLRNKPTEIVGCQIVTFCHSFLLSCCGLCFRVAENAGR